MVSEKSVVIETVTNITWKELKGVYAPATFCGNIVVDGVLASCYSEYELACNHKIAHIAFSPLRMKSKVFGLNKKENNRNGVNEYCTLLVNTVYPVYKTIIT